jgi:hypothetical protein
MHPTRIALALAVLAAAPAVAEEPCFCLQEDPASDRLWYDCIQYNKGLSPDPLFDCYSSTGPKERQTVKNGERQTVKNGDRLSRIPDGTSPCKPCRDPQPSLIRTCRGDQDGQTGGTPEHCK